MIQFAERRDVIGNNTATDHPACPIQAEGEIRIRQRSPIIIPPAVLTYAMAAVYLGLPSANALRQMVCRGQAPPSFQFGKRDRRFRVIDIDNWLAAKAAGNDVQPQKQSSPRRRGRPTKAEQMARQAQ